MAESGSIRTTAIFNAREGVEGVVSRYTSDPHSPQAAEVRQLAADLIAQFAEIEDENRRLREVQRQLEDYRDRYIDLSRLRRRGYA